jgi:hypothetical protein
MSTVGKPGQLGEQIVWLLSDRTALMTGRRW